MFTGRWQGYRLADLRKDFISGITVGVIAIPLGMAFAIASGVKPEYGLYTTVIAGIIIALLGGSRFQVGGPTGAFIPILLAIVLQYGYENLLIAGFMAGIFLIIMGVLKMGALIQYIPRPVTIGFTTGIAVIIFFGQIGSFLGMEGMEQQKYFHSNVLEIVKHLHTVNVGSVLTALVCLLCLIIIPKYAPKVPASLIGIIVSTLFAILFFGDSVATIESSYGAIPAALPTISFPEISVDRLIMLVGPALTIALLGAIESLLSAVVADGLTGTRHNSNKELVGQGVANIVTPLFGGIPATGAIARTAANIKSGAVSPFSAVIHGIAVLFILLLFAPYASRIPLAGMAPILMVVAWNMSSRHYFSQLVRMRNGDSAVTLVTFVITVLLNLTMAVTIGLVLAALLFIKRMSEMVVVTKQEPEVNSEFKDELENLTVESNESRPIAIYRVEGPLFFGAAQYFLNTMLDAIQSIPKVLIIQLETMPFIDASGEANLHALIKHFQGHNSIVLFTGLQDQPKEMLLRSGLYHRIGKEHIFDDLEAALQYANSTWGSKSESDGSASA